MSGLDVLIVGAGPAGLAMAIELAQARVRVRILERLAQDRIVADAGGAYELNATTLDHLDALGVQAEVRARGLRLARFELRSHRDALLQRLDFAGAGFEMLSITRAELQRCLWSRVDALGIEVVGAVQITSIAEADESVTVKLASGEVLRADVVVGADGMHSVVRRALFDAAPAIDVGIAAYWGRTHVASAALGIAQGQSLGFTGVGRSLVVTHSEREDAWLFTLCVTDPDRTISIADAVATLPPRARTLVENAAATSATRLYEQKPLREWTTGRAILIGDAAHGMTPFLGLGANSAIEDARLFGGLLAAKALDAAAWRALAQARRKLLNPRIAQARRLGAMMCSPNPIAHALFRGVTRAIPSALVLRKLRGAHRRAEP